MAMPGADGNRRPGSTGCVLPVYVRFTRTAWVARDIASPTGTFWRVDKWSRCARGPQLAASSETAPARAQPGQRRSTVGK